MEFEKMNDAVLQAVEKMKSSRDAVGFADALNAYILSRLGLPFDTKEKNIYYLVRYSVRIKMPSEDIKTLESRLATVDCHQTSYIVSKKTLLMMEIEQTLGVSIPAEKAADADDVDSYSALLWEAIGNETK